MRVQLGGSRWVGGYSLLYLPKDSRVWTKAERYLALLYSRGVEMKAFGFKLKEEFQNCEIDLLKFVEFFF